MVDRVLVLPNETCSIALLGHWGIKVDFVGYYIGYGVCPPWQYTNFILDFVDCTLISWTRSS